MAKAKQQREALAGDRTFDEVRSRVQDALRDLLCAPENGDDTCYMPTPWIRDLSDDWVAYQYRDETLKRDYSIDDAGLVTFGDPVEVEVRVAYDAAPVDPGDATMTESIEKIAGHLIEAKGTDELGGRVFGVRMIAYGDSKNGRRYPAKVLREAVGLYNGVKAFDHHRSADEMRSSTLVGLVGQYRNAHAETDGLYADLHLLPSAVHVAEAFDASLAAQADGLPPLVGISHDVAGLAQPIVDGGRRLMEATRITAVNSADVVADPAAGGAVVRMVAGGIDDTNREKESTPVAEPTDPTQASPEGAGTATRQTEAAPLAPVADDQMFAKESVLGRSIVRGVLEDRKLDVRHADAILEALPDRFAEADVVRQVAATQRMLESVEKSGLVPTVPDVQVTKDALDNRVEKLNNSFDGKWSEGYTSIREAYVDITGANPRDIFSGNFAMEIMRESIGTQLYDSRMTESIVSTTWNKILGDSITRRMVMDYKTPDLQTWRPLVTTVPVNDFRTQRLDRLGGFGILPAVGEGAPYQDLGNPTNEEATYAAAKKGGTADLTFETVKNDDMRSIVKIPQRLGMAAANTLYQFVFDLIVGNPTCTYDSTNLFAAGHGNTDTNALSGANVSNGRKKMLKQTMYGDSNLYISPTPKYLITVPDLEELAVEICTSPFAMPSGAPVGAATALPNIHQGMTLILVPYWVSATGWNTTTAWFLSADPNQVPTIEVGFLDGREDPELFAQTDPTQGSAFNADKVVYKIRHIYGGTNVDHRGLYRGNA